MDANIGKNIWYASIGNIIPSIFTYAFWFVTARLVGPEVIGHTSAIVSLVMIVATVDVLNMSLGMKRYLGIASSSGDKNGFKHVIAATVMTTSLLVVTSVLVLAIPDLRVLEALGIDRQYFWIIAAMIPAIAFQQIFSEALVAALKSKDLVFPLIIGSLSRFPVLFAAIYVFAAPGTGTIVSYSLVMFISVTFYAVSTIKIFRGSRAKATENMGKNARLILNASLVSWVPQIISVLGSQLGVITVFSVAGAAAGGKFYIPMAIFTAALFIVSGINRVSHSLIAGMQNKEQQIDYVSYSLKVAFIFTLPLSSALLFFAKDYLELMGREFGEASTTLTILMISLPMVIIAEVIYYFVYGKGEHGAVLRLGLAGNVPRTVLYFILVPLMSANGAAIAYLVGSMFQLVLSIHTGNKHQVRFDYRTYIVSVSIPVMIGLALWWTGVHYLASTTIIIVGSFLAYVRIRVFTDRELHSLLFAGLPKNAAEKVYPVLSRLMGMIG